MTSMSIQDRILHGDDNWNMTLPLAPGKCFALNKVTLQKLERNDSGVTGLSVSSENWIKGAGRILGVNTSLRKIEVNIEYEPSRRPWLDELFTGLSRNRTLESIKLHGLPLAYGFHPCHQLDNFSILAPFFEHNFNLCYIELNKLDMSFISHHFGSALMKCNNSRLEHLHFFSNRVTDKQLAFVLRSLLGKQYLRRISSLFQLLHEDASYELANLLCSKECTIQSLRFQCNENTLDYDVIYDISQGLICNDSVKSLDLGSTFLTAEGWYTLSLVLAHNECSLKKLELEYCQIDNKVLTYLGDALHVNKSLEVLNVGHNEESSITLEGWRGLFKCFKNPNLALEELRIYTCDINDESVAWIAKSLAKKTPLRKLDIRDNESITLEGWVAFIDILLHQNSCCSLEKLDLSYNATISDNKEEFEVTLTRAICDKTSIDNIYTSNHTVQLILLGDEDEEWSQELMALLEINTRVNKVEVAREKILSHHFCASGSCTDVQLFHRMPDAILPFALEWIGRGKMCNGFSMMHSVVKGFPLRFNVGTKRRNVGANDDGKPSARTAK